VLVVWCRKDPIVPLRAGRQLAAALPRARLAILEGCHHLPQHERPQALLRTLRPFLSR
jgi:pimeloyl-ACP methyl ester carboxylesterase